MKATGVIRKIDELGRLVIPKEIRTTMKIREGDPMEIFIDRDGVIILKKYSTVGEMASVAANYAESLSKVSGYAVIITDKYDIIAAAGSGTGKLVGKAVSEELEEAIADRKELEAVISERCFVPICKEAEKCFMQEMMVPVISDGDVIGCVMLLSSDERKKMEEAERKLLRTAAMFLGSQTGR